MAQLFSHLGRKSSSPRLFQSIKPQTQMMQNLLDIESRTGGDRWLKAVDDELTRQKKTTELREGPSALTKYFIQPMDKLKAGVGRLFGQSMPNEEIMGETASRGGVPFGSSNVYVKPDIEMDPRDTAFSKTLKGRNPYVQSLVDTMRHELGGHVAEQLAPNSPRFNLSNPAEAAGIRENAARALSSETPQTPRSAEVEQYFGGVTPRKRDEDY